MRILFVTDTCYPQINGVVTTLAAICDQLRLKGDTVKMLTPEGFNTLPCPTDSDLRLALAGPAAIQRVFNEYKPTVIHIVTEGPLGFATRRFCLRHNLPFTSTFHTRFPEHISARLYIPENWIYPSMRWFHAHSKTVMAPTQSVVENLCARGFKKVRLWEPGVAADVFKPGVKADIPGNGPVFLYVGRVAVEKNIKDFLDLTVSGTKVVVGDGPLLEKLKNTYPSTIFTGFKRGKELVSYFNAANVFVFPSCTDTYGLVMLEALACGVPVAAYPVMGPKDVITDQKVGSLSENLADAVRAAQHLDPNDCRAFAEARTWQESASTFRSYLHEFNPREYEL